jgi:hypothetical protein
MRATITGLPCAASRASRSGSAKWLIDIGLMAVETFGIGLRRGGHATTGDVVAGTPRTKYHDPSR